MPACTSGAPSSWEASCGQSGGASLGSAASPGVGAVNHECDTLISPQQPLTGTPGAPVEGGQGGSRPLPSPCCGEKKRDMGQHEDQSRPHLHRIKTVPVSPTKAGSCASRNRCWVTARGRFPSLPSWPGSLQQLSLPPALPPPHSSTDPSSWACSMPTPCWVDQTRKSACWPGNLTRPAHPLFSLPWAWTPPFRLPRG